MERETTPLKQIKTKLLKSGINFISRAEVIWSDEELKKLEKIWLIKLIKSDNRWIILISIINQLKFTEKICFVE